MICGCSSKGLQRRKNLNTFEEKIIIMGTLLDIIWAVMKVTLKVVFGIFLFIFGCLLDSTPR